MKREEIFAGGEGHGPAGFVDSRGEPVHVVAFDRAGEPGTGGCGVFCRRSRPAITREQVERVRRGHWITVSDIHGEQWSKCGTCQSELDGLEDAYMFCPYCGAPMTDEAVDIIMERLEALNDGESDRR